MPVPTALFFDWDNTLVNNWPAVHAALNAVRVRYGLAPFGYEESKHCAARSARDSFPEWFGDQWQEAHDFFYTAFRERNLEFLTVLPGADALLHYAKATNLPCVIVSNKRGEDLRREVAHLGWQSYFQAIVGAGDAAYDKPHPAVVDLAAKPLQIQLSASAWFIGDSFADMDCARNSGLTAVLVGTDPATLPATSQPDLCFSDCNALKEALKVL
jgi:phosphoglycolate phosphatase